MFDLLPIVQISADIQLFEEKKRKKAGYGEIKCISASILPKWINSKKIQRKAAGQVRRDGKQKNGERKSAKDLKHFEEMHFGSLCRQFLSESALFSLSHNFFHGLKN
ncbi:hypothetical protein [Saccharibacillus sacchari]|uniref:Uncharacterized protein n=1 Tax=Saccharibacillus sacchari TaxID=456493 RepID=A0ACC6PBG4_9BACL